MCDLLEFTREEWADKGYLIELRGGYYRVLDERKEPRADG